MKIKNKLLVGFGFYTLLAVAMGCFMYLELHTIISRLAYVKSADDIVNNALETRRYEKNLLLFNDKGAINELDHYITLLRKNIGVLKKEIVKKIGAQEFAKLSGQIDEYEQSIHAIARNPADKGLIEKVRIIAREIQATIDAVAGGERASIDYLLAHLNRSMILLLFTIAAFIIAGAIINMKLAASISNPIRDLEEATKRVGGGDLSWRSELTGRDEIASLGMSFNRMQERLSAARQSLELAITELHEKQEQLLESEKLASLGRIAAGVAHEINNPLAIVNEKAGLMQDIIGISDEFQNKDKFMSLIQGIVASVDRCRAITHHLLGYARPTESVMETMSLNDVLADVKGFLHKELEDKRIAMETNFPVDLPQIRSDKGQLEQVVLNIVRNAIEAVSEGGHINISSGMKDSKTALISIADDGPGIPQDKVKHLFEPFFTTKGKKGTGLGLFVSYGIVKKLGGMITAESKSGRGTTFTIQIPVDFRQ
ncbi:MAG: ATP-binding protein [Desulfobulbaceae bacterium]|nr:ATP-binding protein [Desulfobulbaceae bacterium]